MPKSPVEEDQSSCGTAAIAMQGLHSIYGIDPNPAMEPYAQQAAVAAGLLPGQLRLQQGTAEALPLPDASVDLVICTLVRL